MRKVLHKVKSQWIVLGVLGATVVSLGTADVRQVAASEIEGAIASETLAARELGTADVSVEAADKATHIGLDNALDTATTDGTATVFVHWNEDGTITATVKDLNGSVLHSDLLVDSEGENTIKVLTANQDYYTINIAVKAATTEQTTTATEPIEQALPEVLAEVDAAEEVAAEENDYAKIVSTTEVDYPAVIARATDAINTAPWGVEGYQTLASSADYAGKTVDVTKEQVTDYGVTWALVSLNGKELGWIAKDALTVQTYAAITSETVVDYPATISRGTDAINLAPWGTKGYQTIASSAAYVGKTVDVIKEQTTDYGVTWAQISLNGEVLGWIAKDALAVQTYAAVVSETVVDYPATISRDSDAINTAPWGVKGYQTLSSSAAYAGQTVEVKKEQVTDYGVTWAQISLNDEVLGWIAKDALKVQTFAQITKETDVDYSATISRDSDAINTAPWGVKGYQTLSSSAAFVGQTVEVTKEQITDYGVTWALVSQNGKELGWIAKDALKVQTYAQITKETAVSYDAIVNRDSDAINTAPWGVKGYQTLSSSAAYVGQTVEVTKEQVTDYGVTWALVSQNGKELGWIAKDALKGQTYAQITKETAVNYDAIVNRDSDAINTAPWGVKGYQTLSSSAAYAGQTVEVTKEQTTDYGVTWALVSQNGKELGWIAKDALKVQTYSQIVSENEVAYPALISRGTDAINTAPWGTKGYQTNASSADYLGQTVEVTKEQTTDYGVTWALVSLNGKELGWIAKDALTVLERTVETVVAKENTVAYQTVTEEDNTIPIGERVVVQAGVEGYDTVTYDVTYVNGVETNRVEVSRVTTAPVTEIVKVGTQVTKVKTETTTENELAFTTVEEEDSTIPTGDRVVVQAGVNGFDTVMFDVTFVNGVETNRIEVSRTTTAPVNEIIKVGTQVTEVKTEMTTENEVTYATVEEFDNTIPTGERVVVKAGEKGYDTVNYDVTYVNGIETNRVEISRETIAPVSEIVKVGTQVTEVKSETATENEVGFATVEEFDNTIPTGERVVAQTGVNGFDTVTYAVTFVNGIETNRVEVSRTTTAPVSEIVKVGTKISVSDIFVTSKDIDSIILNSSILQMTASISPDTATVTDVTWSVDSGTGTASIDSTGLLTAMSAGTVTVKATANDGSKVVGTQKIEIASPITITSYNGSNLGIVIPEVLEYGNYGDYSVGERLNYGEKGIVTSIGFKAMYNKQLTSVVMPESVTQIGDSAFGSNQLISIVIPKNVTSIGEYAFGYNQLISAVIPPSVTSIGSDAFRGNQLTFVVIPESLTSIGDGAFGFNQLTSIVIPSMVTSIGSYAFTGNELTSVIIPESVISIGSSAFWDNKITNVVIPGNVTSIGHGAFSSNGLTSVVIPENLINIASYLFSGNKLTSVVIPSNVTSIGFNAFANNELASIIIPEKVTSIGSYAFWDNNLTNIVIPVKVTDIGSYAFWRNQLTSVLIPSSVTAIGGYAFQSNQLTNIFIPDSMKFIGSGAFSQNQITSITIGEGVQIGDNLLASNNYFRTAYTIGGAGTYSGTQDGEWIKIQEITVEEHNLTSKENVVDYKRVQQEDNTFPAGQMEVIQEGVDGYDTVTYEVKYTNGVETGRTETRRTTTAPVDEIVRVGTQETVKSITVSAAGDTSIVLNGEQLQMSAIATPEDATEVSVIWSVEDGSGKATIDEYGLLIATESGTVTVKATAKDGLGALGIKEISVAVPVKVIDYAGDDTSIEIPEIIIGNQKGGGGDYEGIYISNLLDYDEIGIVTDIEGYAFFNCYLTSVVIPSNVTSIGSYAFRYNKLSSVVIPENVTSIGAYAFSTNQLVSVLISGSVTDIGSYAFYSNQLSSVIIPESVVNIGSYAFCYNELSNVVISEGVTNIGSCAFYDNQLTNIVIPESVTSIGSSAFSSNKLTRITIGEGVMIGDNLLGGSGNNHFRNAYEIGGAGSYVGTQSGYWTKIS